MSTLWEKETVDIQRALEKNITDTYVMASEANKSENGTSISNIYSWRVKK